MVLAGGDAVQIGVARQDCARPGTECSFFFLLFLVFDNGAVNITVVLFFLR